MDEFEITGLVVVGGFGIGYLAFDHSSQRRVAVKEYVPRSLSDAGLALSALSILMIAGASRKLPAGGPDSLASMAAITITILARRLFFLATCD